MIDDDTADDYTLDDDSEFSTTAFYRPDSVEVQTNYRKTIKDLASADSCFQIVLHFGEQKLVWYISGGNGGAYGANLDVIERPSNWGEETT